VVSLKTSGSLNAWFDRCYGGLMVDCEIILVDVMVDCEIILKIAFGFKDLYKFSSVHRVKFKFMYGG
jgi:hypothetical protein